MLLLLLHPPTAAIILFLFCVQVFGIREFILDNVISAPAARSAMWSIAT
jgi:hypothetical protein